MKAFSSIIERFNGKTVLVIGDIMVDVYLQGSCSRIAPEASIPIVDLQTKKVCLGGAANVAANLKAMGAKVLICSVAGCDDGLAMAKDLLEKMGIESHCIVKDENRHTLIKTRVSSNSQTIVRYDEGTTEWIGANSEANLILQIEAVHGFCDAILIADYNKGVLSDGILKTIYELQKKSKKFLAIDTKNFERFALLKPDLIKPNYVEALDLIEEEKDFKNRPLQIQRGNKILWKKAQAKFCAVTLDQEGVCFFKKDSFLFHLPAQISSMPYVSGAGDTFISACLLGLISNSAVKIAATIAMEAAFIAIQKENTAICYVEELLTKFKLTHKVLEKNLSALCDAFRAQGKRIVFTNGCFDVLHSGHVSYLKGAKKIGDVLIVGLNKDESVTRLKGTGRPINSLEHRMAVLSELNCVDYVIPFGDENNDTPIDLIKKIRPDVFVKGADYEKKIIPELKVLKEVGAEIVLMPLVENQSTTQIIARIRRSINTEKLPLSS